MLDAHSHLPTKLADLVASRLCHDLVNPLGAIGNGVELLEMTGKADGPEMELIRDAVKAAEARIRLFRLAFGGAVADQSTSNREAREAVEGYFNQSRIMGHWRIGGDRPRQEIKLLMLMLLCAETGLPMGGDLYLQGDGERALIVEAHGPRLTIHDDLWSVLPAGEVPEEVNLKPSQAQFAVAIHAAAALGLSLAYEVAEGYVRLAAR
ncbi:histidine phosphotransferase family protein [Gymnodinialimonas hymeniacidonis]|uniref:histidine phosphotransferase family protein n=1 Tax=Gymnodinialimonas hymeniacidonis TaxID=3126508 RepID=UPI0034C69584